MKIGVKATLRVFLILFLVMAFTGAFAAPQAAPAGGPDTAGLIRHLHWRSIGPANMVGRISDFEALDKDFTQVLVGTASGGVFKSVNAGTTWEPIFDRYGAASIGDVAFFQKDPSIIWVGTGEECVRNSVAWGDGIYKSTDGGKTFTHMGLETTQTIARVLTHPTDPGIAYVAASGHPWGYTGDRGLFKTADGGKSWTKLAGGLPNDGKTGAIDLVMSPADPETLYVAFWQRLRQPWRFDSGGPNSGIFKTTDGGQSWTKLVQGIPSGDLGRIGLAISRSNPQVLMAVVEATFQPQATIRQGNDQKPNPDYEDMTKLGSGMYRSEDGGATWKFMSRQNNRPFYYSHITINPLEDKWVYWLATSMSFSPDGGKTWSQIGGLHPDFHAMWIDPTNKDRFYVGQDGGASLTYDQGRTWVFFDNFTAAQFYALSTDMRDPYYVYGGLQDNGSWGGPSMSREGQILTDFWFNIGGGDGFHTQNDPQDWRTAYVESQGGAIQRVNVETRESKQIRPTSMNVINYREYYPPAPPEKKAPAAKPGAKPAAKPGAKPEAKAQPAGPESGMPPGMRQDRGPFRFNWSTPILLSAHNSETIFMGGNHLFKSVDRGDHWMILSPDLTMNDKSKYAPAKPTGGITPDVTGAETYGTIITIAESPRIPGLIWVGTDDGNVQLTKNDGVTWTNVRPAIKGVPPGLWCSRVEASHFDDATCYVTFDGHRSDDFHPYVFKTADFGKTWTSISAGIPEGQPVYVIREDPVNKSLLFLGTEFGAFFSLDGGASWSSLLLNMPTVAFHDLLIQHRDGDLLAATHGRGIWILDDISALRKATEGILGQDAFLFEPSKPGTRWLRIARGGYGRGDLFFKGQNPPEGAPINFYVKAKPDATATLEIADPSSTLKTTYILDAAEAGINRLVWDMRFDPPAATTQTLVSNIKRQLDPALLRTDLTDEQKAALKQASTDLDSWGTNYRKVADIQRRVFSIIRPGGGFFGGQGMRGGMGGQVAEPGTYAVKLTAGGKTLTGKVAVRLDPMLTDK
ncbi:MAG: WD40/YVTN/BNR-like repeat-containing protein [Candidatus Aminicenantales bacterium]